MKLYMHALVDLTLIPAGVIALTWTSAEWLTIIAAVSGLATVVGGLIINIILTVQARKDITKTNEKVDNVEKKADVISGHVNSAATKSAEQINALQNELRLMRELAAEKKEIASVLAQASAHAGVAPGADPTRLTQQIEKNTKDTAVNTERTDATVQDLKDKA